MPGPADFVLARIAEDEAVARAAVQTTERGGSAGWYWSNAGEAVFLDGTSTPVVWGDEQSRPAGNHIVRHDPARVLAECAAKRRILTLASDAVAESLALAYAHHPDFDEDWRP
jgi:hypothetical protein